LKDRFRPAFFYRICSGWLPQGGRRGWLRAEVAGGGHGVKAKHISR
jgi:hypothetical protein